MPAAEDRPISEFPIALQLLNTALVLVSNPDGLGSYDSNHATLAEIGRVILETQYTQDLGNIDVFTAIKNCRVLSGTATPAANIGQNGQLYVKYQTVSNTDTVVGLYFKKDGAWLEIATGGGGGGASWKDITGTLTTGSTTLTLTDSDILTSSTIDIYTDTFGVNPTAVSVSTGSITLTFEAQQTDIEVKVRIS